jgi:hypothetical protein
MRIWRLFWLAACVPLCGCVYGYGRCLWLQPIKSTLTGTVHFRDYPAADGLDNVPILALDRTAYIYVPTSPHLCLPANEIQLTGVSEFPQGIEENTRAVAYGSLYQSATSRQHTDYLMNVITVWALPTTAAGAAPASAAAQ